MPSAVGGGQRGELVRRKHSGQRLERVRRQRRRRRGLLLLLLVRLLRRVLVRLLLLRKVLRGVLRLRRGREAAERCEAAAAVVAGQRGRVVVQPAHVGAAAVGHRMGRVHVLGGPAEEHVGVLLLEGSRGAAGSAVQREVALLRVLDGS